VVSRGDIWLVLPEGAGAADTPGPHPCVVLSPPEIHDHLGLVTVAPIADSGVPAAFRVPVNFANRASVIRLEQVQTVTTRALTRQVGTVEGKTLGVALATLREMFAD
jgi:mRNA interferase MazF